MSSRARRSRRSRRANACGAAMHQTNPNEKHSARPVNMEIEAILRSCTYNREQEIGSFRPLRPEPVQNRIAKASLADPGRTINPNPGLLSKLPLELLWKILLEMDVGSIFALRKTSAWAWQMLNNLKEYRIILEHAYGAFCALVKSRWASCVTLREFYRLLCRDKCSVCGCKYGNRVYFPDWVRFCDDCVYRLKDYKPWPYATSHSTFLHLRSARRILNLNHYSMKHLGVERRCTDRAACHPCNKRIVSTGWAIGQYEYQHDGAFPPEGKCQRLIRASGGLSTVWYFPVYNPVTREVQHGVSCAGCKLERQYDHKVYSVEEYMEHFLRCERGQELWVKSKGGKEKPFRIKGRYEFVDLSIIESVDRDRF